MEKRYIERLLQEEKYLDEFDSMYNEMVTVHRFKRKLDDIEKELVWYAGDEKNQYLPDYMGFYQHAYDNYIPHENSQIVKTRYKALLGEYNVNEIPGYLYCLALLGHLNKKESDFLNTHGTNMQELSREEIANFHLLHSKVKLLISFFDRIDSIVAVYINSIDNRDIEYLDDGIKDLDARAVKHRFMTALHNRDKNMAFRLLGRMRELDEGEDYYFEALTYFIDEGYDDCIRYINKIEKDNIDYSSGIALKLECFSMVGNLSEFIRCIEENHHMQFEFWHILYLLMLLFLHFDVDGDDFDRYDSNFLEKIDFIDQPDTSYIGQTYRLAARIITEGLEILETIESLTETVPEFEIPDETKKRFFVLQMTLQLFQDPMDFNRFLDFDYLRDKEISDIKEEAETSLLQLLIDRNPDNSFENINAALMMLYRLGDIEAFTNNINSNFEALLAYLSKGEDGVEELIRMAYVEEMLLGEVDSRVKEHIETQEDVDLNKDMDDKRIFNFLSAQGKMAYEAAEWQFAKSREKDYGWKDAGLISLGYYRILEVELNQKLIIPLLSGIKDENSVDVDLNIVFTNCANALSGDSKKEYKRKWGTILKTYQEMEESDFQGNGFMIGVLDHFFRAIGSQFDASDSLAVIIKNNLGAVLNAYGLEQFDQGFFEGITNDSRRNKYRNPPAHTRYLQYSVACECRDVFRETVLQFGKMLINS